MGTDRNEARDEQSPLVARPALLSDPSPLTESLEQASKIGLLRSAELAHDNVVFRVKMTLFSLFQSQKKQLKQVGPFSTQLFVGLNSFTLSRLGNQPRLPEFSW